MTRVLVFGDLAETGFGTVTLDLGKAMLDRGDDVRFASINEGAFLDALPDWLAGRVMKFDTPDGWLSSKTVTENYQRRIEGVFGPEPWDDGWAPDAAIFISDVGGLKLSPWPRFLPDGFPAFHYVPIEGVDLPPTWARIWARIKPVAVTESGAIELEKVLGYRPPFAYHGVDTSVFYPASKDHPLTYRTEKGLVILQSKQDCKRFLGDIGRQFPNILPGLAHIHPDRTLILRVDRNVARKRYPSLLRCLAPVLARHPEADFVYHCRTMDQGGDLADDIGKYRDDVASRMLPSGFHDAGAACPRDLLRILYNAADVYVSVSAEGFGLTIAEALACGVPAVGMDFSAVPEVIGKAGVLVPPGFWDDNIYGHYWAGVNEPLFSDAVESLIVSKGKRRDLGNLGPIHVGALFSWAKAAETFAALIGTEMAVAA